MYFNNEIIEDCKDLVTHNVIRKCCGQTFSFLAGMQDSLMKYFSECELLQNVNVLLFKCQRDPLLDWLQIRNPAIKHLEWMKRTNNIHLYTLYKYSVHWCFLITEKQVECSTCYNWLNMFSTNVYEYFHI